MTQTHTVVADDTLWKVAGQFYGQPRLWPVLVAANNDVDPTKLAVGTILTIPDLGSARVHDVVAGDELGKLAQSYYGDVAKWTVIALANGVKDPTKLPIGQLLWIPDIAQQTPPATGTEKMVDLFRYIEHDFAVPQSTDSVGTDNQSQFQQDLDDVLDPGGGGDPHLVRDQTPAEQIRALSREFLADNFSSATDDPTSLGAPLSVLAERIAALPKVTPAAVRDLVKALFGKLPGELVGTAEFKQNRELLENASLAAKLDTAFTRIDIARVVRQLRAAVFIADFAGAEPATLNAGVIRQLLDRPVRISERLLAATVITPATATPSVPVGDDTEVVRLRELRRERDLLRSAYDTLIAVTPEQAEFRIAEGASDAPRLAADTAADAGQGAVPVVSAAGVTSIVVGSAVRQALGEDVAAALSHLSIDLATTPLPSAVELVSRRLTTLGAVLLPAETPQPATVFQVGAHLFAEAPTPLLDQVEPPQVAAGELDFSKAVTRPVGYGNLQVVRQELVGYEPGEISHIENVLTGELLRRTTTREELSEQTLADEIISVVAQERDQQSTDRNELTTETQREASKQTTTSQPGMSSTDYGRLVENSKSNFARTVSARAVESVTQTVRTQRVARERKTYTEVAVHELDNKSGDEQVRGIYQWVNKRYSLRLMNYGKRLLYDVVVPEPAATFVDALKNSAKPETFELVKPVKPGFGPESLYAGNYRGYAAQYGVAGSVNPPPKEFREVVVKAGQVTLENNASKADNADYFKLFYDTFSVTIPDGYKAYAGLVTVTTPLLFEPDPVRWFDFWIGPYFVRYQNSPLNQAFSMGGQTGELAGQVMSFRRILQFSYNIAITCQRTDEAYQQWQLTTYAAIVSGYQRQLAEYEDRLARYVSTARARLALTANYAHNPSVQRDEMKKAFIALLLGEHPGTWLSTPPPRPTPANPVPPDPVAVREWGSVVAFFERAFEWENMMFTFYPYYWGRSNRWEEMLLAQDADPDFEAFLKAGAARVVVPARPGFEAALAHYQETGDVWLGEEMPDMFGDNYVSIIAEIKAANFAPGEEVCVEQWEVTVPTTLVLLRADAMLPTWSPTACAHPPNA